MAIILLGVIGNDTKRLVYFLNANSLTKLCKLLTNLNLDACL